MYEKFSDRARKIMLLANQEAQRLNHEYIGTEHILLGLVREGGGVATNVLKGFGVNLLMVRREVERLVQAGPYVATTGKLPLTPRGKKVVEYAIEEAREMKHHYVGTEHILLGLLREKEGVACQVLMNFGLRLEDVRHKVADCFCLLDVNQMDEPESNPGMKFRLFILGPGHDDVSPQE